MTDSIIPIEIYSDLYLIIMAGIVAITLVHNFTVSISSDVHLYYMRVFGAGILIFSIFYLGLRPISGYFGDMKVYANRFNYFASGGEILSDKDLGFSLFMKFLSYIISAQTFFLLCAIIYILPLYYVSKKWFKSYWYYGFLMAIISFSFWPYGTNGIRNGLSTSLFLFAISFDKKLFFKIFFFALSFAAHASMLLPIACYLVAKTYTKPKPYFIGWILIIPISLASGGFWEALFGSLGFDDRLSYFTDNTYDDSFSSTGFRWDFIIYSSIGVFSGWYYIFKKNINDHFYNILYITFIIANAFWILIIRASFSNRFAYLSWFMIAFVIIYPLLKYKFIKQQNQMIGGVIFVYFLITFILTNLF